jgi:hypothetical protein
LPYIVANEAGHVMAWDEEKEPVGQVEDEWDEKPFDEAGYRKFVINFAVNQDPRDVVRATR